MIEIERHDVGDILNILIDGEKLHSDDGESWFLPKALAASVPIVDLPDQVSFEICQHAEDSLVTLDSVPMSMVRTGDNSVKIHFDESITRKYWDGLVGLKPYMEARRDAIVEREREVKDVKFENYEDQGDWISLSYSTTFTGETCGIIFQLVDELNLEIEGAADLAIGTEIWPIETVDNEKQFTLQTVLPLIRKLGFQNVKYNHGQREFGRDILFARFTEFGELEHWGVQVKHGDVSGGANSLIDSILGQIEDAFRMPFYDIYTRQQQRISRLLIVISGKFTNNAIEKICESIQTHAVRNNTIFVDAEKIQTLAERFRRG